MSFLNFYLSSYSLNLGVPFLPIPKSPSTYRIETKLSYVEISDPKQLLSVLTIFVCLLARILFFVFRSKENSSFFSSFVVDHWGFKLNLLLLVTNSIGTLK
uniref:Uncharacterized protein n=1 Tax=Cacopsylla melanoneura TaxID=428564 RepID=A0A8D8M9U6_9HEMI